jgi:hypothetical protein
MRYNGASPFFILYSSLNKYIYERILTSTETVFAAI